MKMLLKFICILVISLLVIAKRESDGGLTATLRAGTRHEVTDEELEDLSELLLEKDIPNEYGTTTLNLQNKVYSNSPSSGPLLEYNTTPGKTEPPTYLLLRQLFQTYERRGDVNAVNRAKNDFLNRALDTDVMKETLAFLNNHGLHIDRNGLKNYLDTIWFTPYFRGQGLRSSGFQHVFMAELKNNDVKGLHNWIFYLDQQNKNQLNYIGYSKSLQFRGYPSSIVKIRYQWKGVEKPSGSMFVATSPELEMALYSICFLYRPQTDCNVKLGTVKINIKTHKFDIRGGEQVIGSAYPTV